uniref:Uncharacterized protein n=1 Tax=Heterorhabditis bacteriophora TaxID=37862 RepID=A0A1I7WDD1_HETBA
MYLNKDKSLEIQLLIILLFN